MGALGLGVRGVYNSKKRRKVREGYAKIDSTTNYDSYTDNEANEAYRKAGLSNAQLDYLYKNAGGKGYAADYSKRQLDAAGLGYKDERDFKAGTLRPVDDPDKVYADITRGEYEDYVKNYRAFEEEMIYKAQNDTSLIDQAREDSKAASALTKGVADRSASRYGAQLTPAQLEAQKNALRTSNTLGSIQAVADAKIAQKESNQMLLADLINIGQGVNRSSQSQMGSAAADATARKNAYEQARAQHKAQTYSTIGSLGAAAILAFAF